MVGEGGAGAAAAGCQRNHHGRGAEPDDILAPGRQGGAALPPARPHGAPGASMELFLLHCLGLESKEVGGSGDGVLEEGIYCNILHRVWNG